MFKDIKKFFSDFINNLRQKRAFRYAPLIAIPCLIAILIPTILAVWHVYFKDDKLFDAHDVTVTLYNNDNKIIATETVIESYAKDSFLINTLTSLNSGNALASRPENCTGEPNYRIYIDNGSSVIDYDCYFTSSAAASYLCLDGRFYTVAQEPYEQFLCSAYSEAAYPESAPPSLLTKQGEVIVPSKVYWKYRSIDGELKQAKEPSVATRTQNFEMSGSISLSFAELPSVCTVKITDKNANTLYDGDLDRLSFITAEPGTLLQVDISASWPRTDDCAAYGMVEYKFTVVCKDYASFDISAEEIYPGEFITLTATDIEQNAEVIYTPLTDESDEAEDAEQADEPSTESAMKDIIPIISYKGGNAYALLPIPQGTPAGKFSFRLSSGAASKEFTVTVKDAPAKSEVTLTKSKKLINTAISEAALTEIRHIMSDVSLKSAETVFFRGQFSSFDDDGFSRGFSYGDHFVIGGTLNEKFSAFGVDYLTNSARDTTVKSLNIGKVVYTGYILHLGNFAVVDHGMGIATWYCHLSSIDCAVGDVLSKGEAVGKCGNSVFLEGSGALLLCSLSGQFIDPDLISGKELLENKTQVSGGNNNDVQ